MSSQIFTLEKIDQPFIHLTNNAVQMYEKNYGLKEEGNQLSFKRAKELLNDKIDFFEMLNGSIRDIIELTLKSVDGKLNPQGKKHCFEIFGYDFMID